MESEGSKLKKIRQELGLSLEEVQKKTKIHLNILKALEGDGLTNLSPVYLKGFLKLYCKFLGVDPKEYILDYKERQVSIADVVSPKGVTEKRVEVDKLGKTVTLLKATSVKLGTFIFTKPVLKTAGLILIMVFLSLGLFNLGKFMTAKRRAHLAKGKTSSKVVAPVQSKKIEATQPPKATQTPTPKPPEAKPKKETVSGIRLVIRARENCWVSLKTDGRVVFQRVLEKGRFETWQANEKIELSLGNAGGVDLEVNGQPFLNLGRRGQARKNIVITKEGLNIGR